MHGLSPQEHDTCSDRVACLLMCCQHGGGGVQVHGHDMSCLAFIPSTSCYVSGAEEKVLRVFQAPQAFTQTLAMAHGQSLDTLQEPTAQSSQVRRSSMVSWCVFI